MSNVTAEHVTVPNPDDFFGVPIFDGPAHEAIACLTSGVYAALTDSDEDCELLVTADSARVRPIGLVRDVRRPSHTAS